MKILLYGGTFDPPHYGHLNNVRAAAACVHPDHVIIMPAGVPPHKEASGTPAAVRLAMCACFEHLEGTPDIPSLCVSDWEVQQAQAGCVNYTFTTLSMLQARYPDAALCFCLGSDMLLSFTTWHRWKDILSMATMVVESRTHGDDAMLQAAVQQLGVSAQNIVFATAPALPMASHTLREKIAKGEDCTAFLPQSVAQEIAAHQLYTAREGE